MLMLVVKQARLSKRRRVGMSGGRRVGAGGAHPAVLPAASVALFVRELEVPEGDAVELEHRQAGLALQLWREARQQVVQRHARAIC